MVGKRLCLGKGSSGGGALLGEGLCWAPAGLIYNSEEQRGRWRTLEAASQSMAGQSHTLSPKHSQQSKLSFYKTLSKLSKYIPLPNTVKAPSLWQAAKKTDNSCSKSFAIFCFATLVHVGCKIIIAYDMDITVPRIPQPPQPKQSCYVMCHNLQDDGGSPAQCREWSPGLLAPRGPIPSQAQARDILLGPARGQVKGKQFWQINIWHHKNSCFFFCCVTT